MPFHLLPAELKLHTFKQLSLRDLSHCRALCKQSRTLVDTSQELVFLRELGAAGVKDDERCLLPRRKKLDVLWKYCIAWTNLHWFCRRRIQLSGTGKMFNVSDGLFFHTKKPSDEQQTKGSIIEWFRLPSRRTPTAGYEPHEISYDFPLAEFAVDALQNLIIGLEVTSFRAQRYHTILCNLYPRTISKNAVHPTAARDVLSCRFVSPLPSFDVRTEICGNNIAILLMRKLGSVHSDLFDMFILMDWTTGVTKAQITTHGTGETWETFCFLSGESILLPSTANNVLNIYHFDDKPDSLRHDVSLLLPEPLRRDGLRHISVRSQPYKSGSSNLHPTGDSPPFVADPDEAVVILQLDYRYHGNGNADDVDHGTNLPQVVAIPRQVLLRHAQLARQGDPNLLASIECSHGRLEQPWLSLTKDRKLVSVPCCYHEQTYAPMRFDARRKRFPHLHPEQWVQHTRWGIDAATPILGSHTYGSRYLSMTSRMVLRNAAVSSIALYDFNLLNDRRGYGEFLEQENIRPYPGSGEEVTDDEEWYIDDKTGRRRWPVLPYEVVTSPSTVSIPEVFKNSFTTTLAYRVTETEMILPWDSAILDGERIIGVEFADIETGSLNFLDVIVM